MIDGLAWTRGGRGGGERDRRGLRSVQIDEAAAGGAGAEPGDRCEALADRPAFAAGIEAFHRDELAHAELGLVLVPVVLERLDAALGREARDDLAHDELRGTLGHLDRAIGLDLERRGGGPAPRPQPPDNPGVVEPAVDAAAF